MKNKNELFKEFEKHLMEDQKPSKYFHEMDKTGLFDKEYPFTLLGKLKDTEQSPIHHPEGSVWNHTMMVVDNAAERKKLSEDSRVFMWAALLHDLGKPPTTRLRKGRITSYDHDKVGKKLAIEFLKDLTDDEAFIKKVSTLVRWHMQTLFVVKNLPFADVEQMASEVSIEEVALLSECDRLGRGGMTAEKIKEEKEYVQIFKEKSHRLSERDLIHK